MYSDNENRSCVFCHKFSTKFLIKQKWFDKELTSTDDFVVVPALGALVEGYLMIVTKNHYRSMALLTAHQLDNLEILKNQTRQKLIELYKNPIIFEHGPTNLATSIGSCIDHAHFQILPFEYDLLPKLQANYDLKPIKHLSNLTEFGKKDKPYIFFENNSGQMFVILTDKVPNQHIRRLIANALGISDQYDYAIFPNYDLISKTINKLSPHFK